MIASHRPPPSAGITRRGLLALARISLRNRDDYMTEDEWRAGGAAEQRYMDTGSYLPQPPAAPPVEVDTYFDRIADDDLFGRPS